MKISCRYRVVAYIVALLYIMTQRSHTYTHRQKREPENSTVLKLVNSPAAKDEPQVLENDIKVRTRITKEKLESEETTTFVPPPFDCGFNFQTVLFCEALKELDIRETHVHYDEDAGLILYKNKAFKPMLPLCVIKECAFNNASVDVNGDRWCNAFHRKPTDLKCDGKYDQCVVKLFNTVLLQRLPRASEFSECPEVKARFPYFHFHRDGYDATVRDIKVEKNLDNLMEHHAFDKLDYLYLSNQSVEAQGRTAQNDTCITHYMSGDRATFPIGNWGDVIGPYITAKLTNQTVCVHTNNPADRPSFVTSGSSIGWLYKNYTVWGTGMIWDLAPVSSLNTYLAVRGTRSRRNVVQKVPYPKGLPLAVGSPALVTPLVYRPTHSPSHNVCLVLHGSECSAKILAEIKKVHFLCAQNQHPQHFIDKLVECSSVLSSSLHGVIVSHAYGIPAAGMKFKNMIRGEDFRFHDYFASMGIYMSKYRHPIQFTDLNKNPQFFMDLINKTPQPTPAKIRQQQKKLMETFPFPVVDDPLSSSFKYI